MKIPKILKTLNLEGVPIPTATDPATGKGSVTFMLLCLSGLFQMMAICNVPNLDKAMSEDWFLYCLGGYLGRTIIKKGKGALNLDGKKGQEEPESSDEDTDDTSPEPAERRRKNHDPSKES